MSFLGRFKTPFLSNSFNSVRFKSYTVAQLSALTASVGDAAFCTDCLTPNGTGGPVYWDGSAWRLVASNIVATTDVKTYLIEQLRSGQESDTAYDVVEFNDGGVSNLSRIGGTGYAGNGGSSGSSVPSSPGIGMFDLYVGTTLNKTGYSGNYSNFAQAAALASCAMAFNVSLTATSSASETFACKLGFDATYNSSGLTANEFGFIYDPQQIFGLATTAGQWHGHSRASSTSTTPVASGINVTTSFQRLAFVLAAGTISFFCNGTEFGTINTNIPSGSTSMYGKLLITKGGTSDYSVNKALSIDIVGLAIRRPSALSLV